MSLRKERLILRKSTNWKPSGIKAGERQKSQCDDWFPNKRMGISRLIKHVQNRESREKKIEDARTHINLYETKEERKLGVMQRDKLVTRNSVTTLLQY